MNATSKLLILTSNKTDNQIKVEIPVGSFELHLNGDELLINGEKKASIDKENTYIFRDVICRL